MEGLLAPLLPPLPAAAARDAAPPPPPPDRWKQTILELRRRAEHPPPPPSASEPPPDVSRLQAACFHIRDAMLGVARVHPGGWAGAHAASLAHLRLVAPLLRPLSCAYLCLTFLEPPLWCARARQRLAVDLCASPLYPSFALPELSPPANLAAEAAILSFLVADVALLLRAQGWRRYLRDAGQRASLGCLALSVADVLHSYAAPAGWWRAAPYLRVCLCVAHLPVVRFQLYIMKGMLPRLVGVVVLIVIYIFFFAWLAVDLFQADSADLPTASEVAWQLLILFTTANFPDVMMKAYSSTRVSCVFFIAFIVFGVFFLANYLLAVVYNAYCETWRRQQAAALEQRKESLDAAFRLLDWEERGWLSRQRVLALFDQLPRSDPDSFLTQVRPSGFSNSGTAPAALHRALLFAVLDKTGDYVVQREEFEDLCIILHLHFRRKDHRSLLDVAAPALASTLMIRRLQHLLLSKAFDHAVDALVLLSGVALALDPAGDVATLPRLGGGELSLLQLCLTALFLAELLLKLAVLPWTAFIHNGRTLFDLFVTSATVCVTVIVYLPNGIDNPAAIRAMLSLRLLRLLRLLFKVESFRLVVATFVQAAPAARKLFQTLGLIMFVFAAAGMHLFGGVITTDTSGYIITSEQAAKLAESEFGQADYYANNFNDMLSGIITLFELLVVNNWFVLASGYEAVLGTQSRCFFVLFYAVGVVIGLNICVAFVLDTYSSLESLESLDDSVTFDAGQITGTATGLEGEYEVTLRHLPLLHDSQRRQQLKALFTRRTAARAEDPSEPSKEPS